MDRRDWLTVAQLSRLTQIGLRTLWRYLDIPGMHRYRRKMPGGKRWLWHRHVVPKLRETYQGGLARTGRRLGNAAITAARTKGRR